MKKIIISLVLFLLCGCFPQSYQNIENKFKQDTCFKYHYQLLNKNQKQLYQTIYNIAYARKQNINIKEKEVVSIGNQTGEGWFLTGEMIELIESGAPNIVCMQPFGCLPNHVTGKGAIYAC